MKYLRPFSTESEYGKATLNYPSVSFTEDDNVVHFDASAMKFVDLGLPSGTKWAKMNIGAEKETDYGLYFQWGDTVGYSDASHSTWATAPGNGGASDYDETAFATWKETNLTDGVLNTSVDAAYQATNGKAKMPTQAQLRELVSGTKSEWTTINDVAGYKFTNKKDSSKYIFIPAAGGVYEGGFIGVGSDGGVWTGSLYSSLEGCAYFLYFGSGYVNVVGPDRYYGFPVRGVAAG